MATGSSSSIITLNVNRLNAQTKRQRLAEWTQKQDPYICCLKKTHFKPREIYKMKVKGWFGGTVFSQLLLVYKAFDFSIFE